MVAAHLVLTRVDVRNNSFTGNAASQLSAAVVGNLNIEMFIEIPIKDMRADSIIELDLEEKKIGVEGIMVVAGLIPLMSSLTRVSLAKNKLGEEGTKVICDALKGNTTVKELDLSEDRTAHPVNDEGAPVALGTDEYAFICHDGRLMYMSTSPTTRC